MTEITVSQDGKVSSPQHISKGAGYMLAPDDWVEVKTPGGGGWGDPQRRDRERVARDVRRGYISAEVAARTYGYTYTEVNAATSSGEPETIS